MGDYIFPVIGSTRISSGIGSRVSPGGIGSTNHQGIDIAAPRESPVVAPTDLNIIFAGQKGGYGNTVIGQDALGNQMLFGHLNSIDVRSGMTIGAGGQIGGVGSTGNSTGNHLHYAVRDATGKFLAGKTSEIISGAKKLASNVIGKADSKLGRAVVSAIPGGSAVLAATDTLGITGECGIICQIKKWFEETEFWQRLGVVVLALILILMAFYLFGSQTKLTLAKGN